MAEWLEVALGIEIPEYGLDRSVCPAYEEMIWAVKPQTTATPNTPQPAVPQPDAESVGRLHDYGRRWARGEGISGLAREAGMSWNRLWSELTKLGYTKGS